MLSHQWFTASTNVSFTPFSWYPIGSYDLVSSLKLPWAGERRRSSHASSEMWTAKPCCFLTHCSLNPEASCTIQLIIEVSLQAPDPPQGDAWVRWAKESPQAKPSPNLDDTGPIVCCLMVFPAGCNTAWDRTQSIDAPRHCAAVALTAPLLGRHIDVSLFSLLQVGVGSEDNGLYKLKSDNCLLYSTIYLPVSIITVARPGPLDIECRICL